MTKREKIRFVKELVSEIEAKVLENIIDDTIPTEWDGFELRQLLSDKFTDAAYFKMPKGRKASYNNDVLVNNI